MGERESEYSGIAVLYCLVTALVRVKTDRQTDIDR
jgi:hypothetical protein